MDWLSFYQGMIAGIALLTAGVTIIQHFFKAG